MNMEKRWAGKGATIAETLAVAPKELVGDIVGFWSVVRSGRGAYGLTDAELNDYVRLYVLALVEHGGKPIKPAQYGPFYWTVEDRYGKEPMQIAQAVTAEWILQGSIDPAPWASLAFAMPEYLASSENLREQASASQGAQLR